MSGLQYLGGGISGAAPIQGQSNQPNYAAPGQSQGGIDLSNYQPAIQQALQQLGQSNTGLNTLAGSLQNVINNPSAANLGQQQLVNATQQQNQAAAGQLAGIQGINPALAARQTADTTAANNMQAAGMSAEARLQQQIAAQQQLANIYGTQMGGANTLLGTTTGAQGAQNSNQLQNQGLNQSGQVASLNAATSLLGAGTSAAGTTGGALGAAAIKAAPLAAAAAAHGGEIHDPRDMFLDMYSRQPANSDHAEELLNAFKMGVGHHQDMTGGGKVEAATKDEMAEVEGDSEKNDKIPIMASEDEVMVPRTVVAKIHDNPAAVVAFIRSAVGKDGPMEMLEAHRGMRKAA